MNALLLDRKVTRTEVRLNQPIPHLLASRQGANRASPLEARCWWLFLRADEGSLGILAPRVTDAHSFFPLATVPIARFLWPGLSAHPRHADDRHTLVAPALDANIAR